METSTKPAYKCSFLLKLTCILLGFSISILGIYKYATYSISDPIEAIIPLYLIIFGIFMILAEFSITCLISNILFLKSLYGKGLFLILFSLSGPGHFFNPRRKSCSDSWSPLRFSQQETFEAKRKKCGTSKRSLITIKMNHLFLYFLTVIQVYCEFMDHIYAGTWKSSLNIDTLGCKSGKMIIRPYKSDEGDEFISILLESSRSSNEFFFIQTATKVSGSIYLHNTSSSFHTQSSKSSLQTTLNCTLKSHKASCTLSTLTSPFSFTAIGKKLKRNELQEPIVSYSFIISCVSISLILAFSKHTQDCVASERVAQKTSLEFLIFQSAIDFWYSAWHLYLSFNYYLAHEYLILAGFMTFAVYLVIHGRLLMTVWKAQNPGYAQDGLVLFEIRFAVFEGFWLIFIMSFIPAFVLMRDLKMVIVLISHNYLPLIYKSARYGYRHAIRTNVILTITVARLVLIFYLFAIPHEFMGGKSDFKACFWVFVYFFVQVAVVLMQNRNPKFFLPRCCRTDEYSYLRDEEFEKEQDKCECTICMTELNLAGRDNGEVFNFSKTWHTPCKHMFHEDCLKTWMSIKMECPTCRSQLPFTEDF